MSDMEKKSSRRSFITRSAFAAGVVGSAMYVGSRKASARDVPSGSKPNVNYPWFVDIPGAAQASLFLLRGYTVERLLRAPLANADGSPGTLDVMYNAVTNAINAGGLDASELAVAINEDNPKPERTLAGLQGAIFGARYFVQREGGAAVVDRSYKEYAQRGVSSWGKDVFYAFAQLNHFIRVPILNTYPGDVTTFYNNSGGGLDTYNTRIIDDLFTRPASTVVYPNAAELTLWKAARDVGLLWCEPRSSFAFIEMGETAQSINKRKTKEWEGWYESGKGEKCSGGTPPPAQTCGPGNSSDYCQIVDGYCNGMSNP